LPIGTDHKHRFCDGNNASSDCIETNQEREIAVESGSFHRAHAAFELGYVPRGREVLIVVTLFGVFEPAVNPCEKKAKHDHLQEVAPCGAVSPTRHSILFPGCSLALVCTAIVGSKHAYVYLSFFI
jgi:hypothetical protein